MIRTCPKCGHIYLTVREREILAGLAEGESPGALAHRLCISLKTVTTHYQTLKHKLGFSSMHQLRANARDVVREMEGEAAWMPR
jgi:DNA-binding NarL/FixJ family response regulator